MSKNLYVVTAISNPKNFKRRYELYKQFRERILRERNVVLYTVELAIGEREHCVTSPECETDIQVRSNSVLWHKENLLNIGFKSLPSDWSKAIWCDADIMFANPNWVQDIQDRLDIHPVVQCFSNIYDMTYNYEQNFGIGQSYIHHWLEAGRNHFNHTDGSYTKVGAPGYSWGYTREAFETLGGLFDLGILGSGDYYMADSLTGNKIRELEQFNAHPNYLKAAYDWREKAKLLQSNIGLVRGTIFHYWHGKRVNRGYNWRNQILDRNQYDPYTDVYYDNQNLLHLNKNKPVLRDDLLDYFSQRNEDELS